MAIEVAKTPLEEMLSFRDMYRREMNCQIVHDSLPRRGFGDLWRVVDDGRVVGYGFVMGYQGEPRDNFREFYILPHARGRAERYFQAVVEASGATRIEVQTNDVLTTLMLFDFATEVTSERVVFADGLTTHLSLPGATFRAVTEEEKAGLFEHKSEPPGDWCVELEGRIAATGGFLTHYNPPYADIYMEVDEPFRRRGVGSYLVQEVKRITYDAGKVPAARCNVENHASRATLQKAGLFPCARILTGVLAEL